MFLTKLAEACAKKVPECPNCGDDCSHPSKTCPGNCKDCLSEVHYEHTIDGKRKDYDCQNLIFCYIRDFAERYEENMLTLLQNIDLNEYPHFNIFSIGCGAAPDLAAFERLAESKEIFYAGCDKNDLWERPHKAIEKYSEKIATMDVLFRHVDIFDVFEDGSQIQRCYNVVVIQFLISHLYNSGQNRRINELYNGIIDNIISHRDSAMPFLIIMNDIDTINKGRPLFSKFLDLLEDKGYKGKAIAYSDYRGGDLGKTRWSEYTSRRCNTTDNFVYIYKTPPEGFYGAALVIELR